MTDLVYPPVVASMRVAFKLWGLRFDIVGADNIPTEGGAVLASNHVSYLDFIFCGFTADPSHRLVRFMAKDTVFKNHISGPLMRGMKHIPVDRSAGADAFDAALDALKAGEVVGVFPEATISRSFEVKECKTGAARLAQEARVPLIPMVTWGGQRMFSKGTPRNLRRGTCIAMTVGEPMFPDPDEDVGAVTEDLRGRLQQLLEETIDRYPDQPRNNDDRWWLPARLGGTAPKPELAKAEDDAASERRRAQAEERRAQAAQEGEQS